MRIVNESAKREGIDVRTEIWREYYQDASYGYAETFDKLRVSAQHEFAALNVSFVPGWYFLPLGRQDIKIGNTSVDDRYIIKSPHPEVIVQYFDADVYQLLLDTYDAHAVSALELHVSDGTVSVGACALTNAARQLRSWWWWPSARKCTLLLGIECWARLVM